MCSFNMTPVELANVLSTSLQWSWQALILGGKYEGRSPREFVDLLCMLSIDTERNLVFLSWIIPGCPWATSLSQWILPPSWFSIRKYSDTFSSAWHAWLMALWSLSFRSWSKGALVKGDIKSYLKWMLSPVDFDPSSLRITFDSKF